MAAKSTDKTILTIAFAAALLFAAWLIIPRLAKMIGSGGGGSGVNAAGGSPYWEPYNPASGQGNGPSAGLNFGGGGGGGGSILTGKAAQNYLSNFQAQSASNLNQLGTQTDTLIDQVGEQLDQQGIQNPYTDQINGINAQAQSLEYTSPIDGNDIGQDGQQAILSQQLETTDLYPSLLDQGDFNSVGSGNDVYGGSGGGDFGASGGGDVGGSGGFDDGGGGPGGSFDEGS